MCRVCPCEMMFKSAGNNYVKKTEREGGREGAREGGEREREGGEREREREREEEREKIIKYTLEEK